MNKQSIFGVLLSVILGAAGGLTGGCDSEAPVESRVCERLDACNYFGAGVSVDDCTDVMVMCSDDLVRSARADWEVETEDALENNNCSNFLADYQDYGVCAIRTDGSVGNVGGGPGNGDGNGDGTGTCTEGEVSCIGNDSIQGCFDAQLIQATCLEICQADGCQATDGCAFDDERGDEVCFCTECGPTPPG